MMKPSIIPTLEYDDAPAAIGWHRTAPEGHRWNFGTYDPWA